jgi:hypothetical protein
LRRAAALMAAVSLALPLLASANAPPAGCEQVHAEIARAEQARRKASEDADNAWKAVVPFVVLARKAGAKSALEDADKRLAELKPQAQRCTVVADHAQ